MMISVSVGSESGLGVVNRRLRGRAIISLVSIEAVGEAVSRVAISRLEVVSAHMMDVPVAVDVHGGLGIEIKFVDAVFWIRDLGDLGNLDEAEGKQEYAGPKPKCLHSVKIIVISQKNVYLKHILPLS